MDEKIFEKLECIERMLIEQSLLKKEVLNFTEAGSFRGIASHPIITSSGAIPAYKPNGKTLFQPKIDTWLWQQTSFHWRIRNKPTSI